MTYHVYIHYTEPDSRVFYVGLSQRNSRINSKRNRNRHWNSFVDNHEWSAELVHTFDSIDEAKTHERWLINYFREEGHPLTNITKGGERGPVGFKFTEEQRKANVERGRLGGKVCSEAKRLASIANAKKPRRSRKKSCDTIPPTSQSVG